MIRRLAVLSFLLGSPAAAVSYTVTGSSGLDLQTLTLTDSDRADVRLQPLRVEARYGIRLEASGQQYARCAPLVLGSPFLVRDAKGAEYRFWVRSFSGAKRWIEVVALSAGEAPAISAKTVGRYRVASIAINGVPGAPGGRDLRLAPDGTYRFGGGSGSWVVLEDTGQLLLDGYYASWGRGVIAPDGSNLSFVFRRAQLSFEVRLERQQDPSLTMAR